MSDEGLLAILRALRRHDADFIVVGGMAAVIGGAPIVTRDVDVLRERSEENARRLLAAFDELDAVARGDRRRLPPTLSHLLGAGHLLLETLHGPLDVLGTIEKPRGYRDVIDESDVIQLADVPVRVLRLERLLVVKRKLNRPKDRLMALQIEATIAERNRGG